MGFQSDQDMDMIRHSVDGNQLLLFGPDNASNLLVDLFFVSLLNEALSPLDGKDYLNVNL
jgi:hypothetical protein